MVIDEADAGSFQDESNKLSEQNEDALPYYEQLKQGLFKGITCNTDQDGKLSFSWDTKEFLSPLWGLTSCTLVSESVSLLNFLVAEDGALFENSEQLAQVLGDYLKAKRERLNFGAKWFDGLLGGLLGCCGGPSLSSPGFCMSAGIASGGGAGEAGGLLCMLVLAVVAVIIALYLGALLFAAFVAIGYGVKWSIECLTHRLRVRELEKQLKELVGEISSSLRVNTEGAQEEVGGLVTSRFSTELPSPDPVLHSIGSYSQGDISSLSQEEVYSVSPGLRHR